MTTPPPDQLFDAYHLVAGQRLDLVQHLLGRLLGACPDAERLFERIGPGQHRMMALASMSAIARIANDSLPEDELARLRRLHLEAGVTHEHLDAFRREFPAALRFIAGSGWTAEMTASCQQAVDRAVDRLFGIVAAEE